MATGTRFESEKLEQYDVHACAVFDYDLDNRCFEKQTRRQGNLVYCFCSDSYGFRIFGYAAEFGLQ